MFASVSYRNPALARYHHVAAQSLEERAKGWEPAGPRWTIRTFLAAAESRGPARRGELIADSAPHRR